MKEFPLNLNRYWEGPYHTVIGSLVYSAKHVQDLQSKPQSTPTPWGGVFCLSLTDFKAHFQEHHEHYGLHEFSFLGDQSRIDFFQRWQEWHPPKIWNKDDDWNKIESSSIVDQMKKRFSFMHQHNEAWLQSLTGNHTIVQFQKKGDPSQQFWTFQQHSPSH